MFFRKSSILFVLTLTMMALALLPSCKDELEQVDLETGLSYFPMDVGTVMIYDVDTTTYDIFNGTVYTNSSEIREEIIEEGTDALGRPRVKIERKTRYTSDTDWDNIDGRIWYAVRSENQAERVEENLRFVKLAFPITEGKRWEGNAHIDTDSEMWNFYDDWLYQYENIGQSQTINGIDYGNTVTVVQNDYSNLQEIISASEVYADGVGLVYREFMNLKLEASELPSIESNPWPERANTGEHVVWKLKN